MVGCTNCPHGMNRCPRCSTRMCMEHQPIADGLCNPCELTYQNSKSTLKMNVWFLVGFAMPWVVFLGLWNHLPSWDARSGGTRAFTTGVPMLDVMIMFTVTSVIFGKIAMGLREHAHRRAFSRLIRPS